MMRDLELRRLRFITAAWTAIGLSLLVSVIIGIAFAFRGESAATGITVGFAFATALLNLSAVPFFVLGRRHFKQELWLAYTQLATGIALFGVAQIAIPVITVSESWILLDSGALGILFLIAVILMYTSMRTFVLFLGIKTLLVSYRLVSLGAFAAGLFAATLPMIFLLKTKHTGFDPAIGVYVWVGVFQAVAAALAMKIMRSASTTYSDAMGHLNTAFSVMAFAGLHYAAVSLFIPADWWYDRYGMVLLPLVAGGILFVRAGYAVNFIGSFRPAVEAGGYASSLDIITYTASLAADPDKIDDILDEVRSLTATVRPGDALTTDQQQTLAQLYLRLEDYLVNEEKAMNFTTQSLRSRIMQALRLDTYAEDTFWPYIA